VQGNFIASNSFEGTQTTAAAYISEEFQIAKKLKSILGLRVEKYDQLYTGLNQAAANSPNSTDARIFDNENILDLFDLFPSASLIYSLTENSNLRASFYRTTARPSFKEKSEAQISDVLTGITFIGNIDLQETDINNYDIRYESYFTRNQTIAVSAFYKQFYNPIELVAYSDAAPDNFQPRNVGDAEVFGAEIELRKNFGFISPGLENLSLNVNLSVIESRVKYDDSPNGELESRTNNLRTDQEAQVIESIGEFRDMQGQAPYLLNAGLSYNLAESGLTVGCY
jgi:outer membrane receptor protein involved in Fe transport